jgi:hypothetical protein
LRLPHSYCRLPINSAGGAIRVNLLFCPVGKVGFRPPPDDRIPPAINVPLIDETFRKKVSYFWRVKIDFNGQSRSAKGVRDLIPLPLAAAASVEVEVVIPAAPAANTVRTAWAGIYQTFNEHQLLYRRSGSCRCSRSSIGLQYAFWKPFI